MLDFGILLLQVEVQLGPAAGPQESAREKEHEGDRFDPSHELTNLRTYKLTLILFTHSPKPNPNPNPHPHPPRDNRDLSKGLREQASATRR